LQAKVKLWQRILWRSISPPAARLCRRWLNTKWFGLRNKELGVSWEDVFESIDPPSPPAGRARTHRATFIGGDRVVRKAQQPTAREEVEPDLAFPKLFTASGAPGASKVIDMEAVFKHLSISLHRELDFNQKA
jgi:predicted unusual protein kinase regulating ubiquinone biosynthesis (AarF/ABC1/UbiB family)